MPDFAVGGNIGDFPRKGSNSMPAAEAGHGARY